MSTDQPSAVAVPTLPTRRGRLVSVAALVVAATMGPVHAQAPAPTLTTEKASYVAGEPVTFVGRTGRRVRA